MPPRPVMFYIKLPYVIKKRKKWYLASCSPLDVHSQGETERLAKKNLREAISLFLISCFERGTLDEVLKECGFEAYTEQKKLTVPRQDYISIPLPMLINEEKSCSCHV